MADQTGILELRAEIRDLLRKLDRAQDEIKEVGDKSEEAAERGSRAFSDRFVITLGDVVNILGSVADGVSNVVRLAVEQEKAEQAAADAIERLGDSAKVTAGELFEMASGLQDVSNFGDEAILRAQALLAPLNLDAAAMERLTTATLDVAAAMGRDLDQTARNLAKSLEDPLKGLETLREANIVFTEAQRETIRALQEAGDVAGAQALVLEKIESRFGGAAASLSDRFTQFGNKLGDLREQIGIGLLPALESLTDRLLEVSDQSSETAASFGRGIGGAINFLVGAFQTLEGGLAKFAALFVGFWGGTVPGLLEKALELILKVADALPDFLPGIEKLRGAIGGIEESVEGLRVSSEDAAEALNEVASEKAQAALASFEASWQSFTGTVTTTRDAARELRQEVEDTTAAAEDASASTESLAESLDKQEISTKTATSAVRELTKALDEATEAQKRLEDAQLRAQDVQQKSADLEAELAQLKDQALLDPADLQQIADLEQQIADARFEQNEATTELALAESQVLNEQQARAQVEEDELERIDRRIEAYKQLMATMEQAEKAGRDLNKVLEEQTALFETVEESATSYFSITENGFKVTIELCKELDKCLDSLS